LAQVSQQIYTGDILLQLQNPDMVDEPISISRIKMRKKKGEKKL